MEPEKEPTPDKPEEHIETESTTSEESVAHDEAPKVVPTPDKKPSALSRLRVWVKSHKKKSIGIGLLALVLVVVAIALTDAKYFFMNMLSSANARVVVLDQKTNQPVPSASITLDGKTATTGKDGVANLSGIDFGHPSLQVSRLAYEIFNQSPEVGWGGATLSVSLVSTGTPVTVNIQNNLNDTLINGAKVSFLQSSAISNDQGKAVLSVPPQNENDKVTVTVEATGYNKTTADVVLSKDATLNVKLTPAGKVYFLSKRTGKINVMKANLDGTDSSVVLAGTGKETQSSTILLASRDWKYLALLSKRSGSEKLYLIKTADDSVQTMDEGDNINFSTIGWSGHTFVYNVVRNNIDYWQSKREALKSYNADTKGISTIDENQAIGDDENYDAQEFNNYYIVSDGLIYVREWGSASGKNQEIVLSNTDGSGKKVLKSYKASDYYSLSARPYGANEIYFAAYKSGSGDATYTEYEDGVIKPVSIDDDVFSNFYPTYLLSPSGSKTLWYEPLDGKNSLFVGNSDGKSAKKVIDLGEYVAFGWYSDDYMLVSKDSSELYVLSAAKPTPQKITDYHKPDYTGYGYGYGYGGF